MSLTFRAANVREGNMKKETIKYAFVFEGQAHGGSECTNIRERFYYADYTGELASSNEIDEIIWLNNSDRNKITNIGNMVFDLLFDIDLIE